MARIAGIKFENDTRGQRRYIRVDLKMWGEALSDFIDSILYRENKKGDTLSFDDVAKDIYKKHNVKHV